MYPDLSYLFHDLFGTEPDNWTSVFKTFGLLLVLAIMAAAFILYHELRRRQRIGMLQGSKISVTEGEDASTSELISQGIFGFILGFKLLYIFGNFPEFQNDAAAVLLSAKGNWFGGILLGLAFAGFRFWEKRKAKLVKPRVVHQTIYPHDRIGDITIVAALSGIVGAKVFAIIEDLPSFFNDPVGVFFSGAGLAIYGGLIGGFLGTSWYLKRKNIPFWQVADAVAPALMIAYGIGRLGCHFSGDGDWGIVAAAMPEWWFLPDWLWAYDYPNNVIHEGVPIEGCTYEYCRRLDPPVYPTAIYEVVMASVLGGFLLSLRKRLQHLPGMLFFIYLIVNGMERFLIEKIRVNPKYDLGFMTVTQAEIIAMGFILVGALGVWWVRRKGKLPNA